MLPLADLAAAVRQRIRLQIAIFAVVFLAVAGATAVAPRVYSSTASLLFDEAPIDPAKGEESGEGSLSTLLSTQADVLRSNLVAARVVKDLGLITPDVLGQWRGQTGGSGDVALWYGARLLGGLAVAPDRASRVLRVQYTSGNGEFSATMANAFVKAYLDQNLELQTDPAKTYSRWYADRTREVRANLENTQAKLTAFKRRTGIVDSDSTNAESSRLTELQSAVTSAEVGSAELGSRSANSASQSPEVQNSSIVAGLRSSIAAKSAEVSQMSVALGPNHPDRKAAEAELAALNAKLGAAVSQQSTTIQVASSAARSKESTLRGTLDGQKARMLRLAADRAEYDVLRRDVDSARAAYDLVTQRLEAMRLSAVAPSGGVRQLDVARASLFPTEPKVSLRLLLGAMLGILIAIGVAVILEFIRPVVRSSRSLHHTTGIPVLATINFARSAASEHLALDKKAA